MKIKIVLIVFIFTSMMIDTYFTTTVPYLSQDDPILVVKTPWWLMWKSEMLASELHNVASVISGSFTHVYVLSIILSFNWLEKHMRGMRALVFTGVSVIEDGVTLRWKPLLLGVTFIGFIFDWFEADFITSFVAATLQLLVLGSFQSLLQAAHEVRRKELQLG